MTYFNFAWPWDKRMADMYADAILADVFQGRKDHLRDQLMHVMAKANRRWFKAELERADGKYRKGDEDRVAWLLAHDDETRKDERAKIAAAIRAEHDSTDPLELDVDAWHYGMRDAAKIAERAS